MNAISTWLAQPGWSPAIISVSVGWATIALFLLVLALLKDWRYQRRRLAAYFVAGAFLGLLYVETFRDPLWNWDMITANVLAADYIYFFASKAYLLRRTNPLGRAMALNNYSLAFYFALSQFISIWVGGRSEFYLLIFGRAMLALTVNIAEGELHRPPPPYEVNMTRVGPDPAMLGVPDPDGTMRTIRPAGVTDA